MENVSLERCITNILENVYIYNFDQQHFKHNTLSVVDQIININIFQNICDTPFKANIFHDT